MSVSGVGHVFPSFSGRGHPRVGYVQFCPHSFDFCQWGNDENINIMKSTHFNGCERNQRYSKPWRLLQIQMVFLDLSWIKICVLNIRLLFCFNLNFCRFILPPTIGAMFLDHDSPLLQPAAAPDADAATGSPPLPRLEPEPAEPAAPEAAPERKRCRL